jgi:hypothetical protein
MSTGGPRTGEAPIQLELLRLIGHVVVGQVGVDRQIDDSLRRDDDRGATLTDAFCASTASASIREYRSKPTAAMCPDCSPPRMFPAPRISRSDRAIWNPAPSSDALKIACRTLARLIRQSLTPAIQQIRVGASRGATDTPASW